MLGAVVFAVAIAVAFAFWGLAAPEEDLVTPATIIALFVGPLLFAVLGFLAGWFGREGDDVVIAAAGYALVAVAYLAVGSFLIEDWRIAVVVLGLASALVAAVVGRVAFWIGNAICEIRELPTAADLTAPAYPDLVPQESVWTTTAGPELRATLDALAAAVAPGAPVEARAVGVLTGFPRDSPFVVVLARDQLAFQAVTLKGAPIGDPLVVPASALREVSIRSEAADGRERSSVNDYDDLIEVRLTDGRDLRLRLPYGMRGAGTTTGGPGDIRTWLRTCAPAYR